jgi:hypothetical protein
LIDSIAEPGHRLPWGGLWFYTEPKCVFGLAERSRLTGVVEQLNTSGDPYSALHLNVLPSTCRANYS